MFHRQADGEWRAGRAALPEEGFTAANKSYSFDSREVNALPALARGFFFLNLPFSFFLGLEIPSSPRRCTVGVANLSLKIPPGFSVVVVVVSTRGCPLIFQVLYMHNIIFVSIIIIIFSFFFCFALKNDSAPLYAHDCMTTIPSSLLEFDSSGSGRVYIGNITGLFFSRSFFHHLVQNSSTFFRVTQREGNSSDTCSLYKDIPQRRNGDRYQLSAFFNSLNRVAHLGAQDLFYLSISFSPLLPFHHHHHHHHHHHLLLLLRDQPKES